MSRHDSVKKPPVPGSILSAASGIITTALNWSRCYPCGCCTSSHPESAIWTSFVAPPRSHRLAWIYDNMDIRLGNPHIGSQTSSEMLCVPLKVSAVVVLDRLSWLAGNRWRLRKLSRPMRKTERSKLHPMSVACLCVRMRGKEIRVL